jgi:hypothetical protein
MSRARDIASNRTVTYSTTEPSNPRSGDLWIDYTNAAEPLTKVYDGTSWILAAGAGGGDFTSFLFSGA